MSSNEEGILAFTPGWNDDMSRKEYIYNVLALCAFTVFASLVFGMAAATEFLPIAGLFAIGFFVWIVYAIVLSFIWMNNRLRDAGLTSEGWRIFIVIMSFLSGIVGIVASIYCFVKPTEHPVIPLDHEVDHASG